jgi:hypothetical protein
MSGTETFLTDVHSMTGLRAMRGSHESFLGGRRVPDGRHHVNDVSDRGRLLHLDRNVLKRTALRQCHRVRFVRQEF